MSAIDSLHYEDLRDTLPSVPANTAGDNPTKTSITLHYNGPPVADVSPAGQMNQLDIDAHYHIGKIWGYDDAGHPLYGSGIMYHWAVLSDGTICRLRQPQRILWHCANAQGNAHSVSVHFPVGEGQDATDAQWTAFAQLCAALIADYGMQDKQHSVLGHREWPRLDGIAQSWCPGNLLMTRLATWRAGGMVYVIQSDDGSANVREGPGTRFPVALKGKAVFANGTEVVFGHIVKGDPVGGVNAWGWLANGLGFVSLTVCRPKGTTP